MNGKVHLLIPPFVHWAYLEMHTNFLHVWVDYYIVYVFFNNLNILFEGQLVVR